MSKKKMTTKDAPFWTPEEPYLATSKCPRMSPDRLPRTTPQEHGAYPSPAYVGQRVSRLCAYFQPKPGESEHPRDHLPKAVRRILQERPEEHDFYVHYDLNSMGFDWAHRNETELLHRLSNAIGFSKDGEPLPGSKVFELHKRPTPPLSSWDSDVVRKVLRDYMHEVPEMMRPLLEMYQTSTSAYARGIVQLCIEESLLSVKHSA